MHVFGRNYILFPVTEFESDFPGRGVAALVPRESGWAQAPTTMASSPERDCCLPALAALRGAMRLLADRSL